MILERDNHASGELLAHLSRPKNEKLKAILRFNKKTDFCQPF